MDQSYKEFSKLAKLSCPESCSECCEGHHVHTSLFELLPAAQRLYKEGRTEEILANIKNFKPGHCALIKNHRCTTYEERPSLCRLFGLGRIEDKKGDEEKACFSICKILKEQTPEKVHALQQIEDLKKIKTFRQLHLPLLAQIPPGEAEELPLNEALKRAIEKTLLHYSYQEEIL